MTQIDEIVVLAKRDQTLLAAEIREAIIAAAQGVSAHLNYRAEEFLPIDTPGRFGAVIDAPSDEFSYTYEE
jgi:hypothetical protein